MQDAIEYSFPLRMIYFPGANSCMRRLACLLRIGDQGKLEGQPMRFRADSLGAPFKSGSRQLHFSVVDNSPMHVFSAEDSRIMHWRCALAENPNLVNTIDLEGPIPNRLCLRRLVGIVSVRLYPFEVPSADSATDCHSSHVATRSA
jgi:hypothetical protein